MTTDATLFPVNGQAYRLPVAFRNGAGVILTGWGTGTCQAIVTDTVAQSSLGVPTEVGSTGLGYLDLNATQMSGRLIQVHCTIATSGAQDFYLPLYTLKMVEPVSPSGVWNTPGQQILLENLLMNICAPLYNQNQESGGFQSYFTRGLQLMATGPYTEQTGGTSVRGNMT